MRRVLILGSTGSIGTQALDVIRANPRRFEIVGLAAGSNRELVAAQAEEFDVEHTAFGAIEAEQLVRDVEADVVLNGITGSVGLGPTLAALERGRTLALANKESLIVGGDLVTSRAKPGQIVPVDSEHSAIAQALRAGAPDEVRRLVLTASGGPFRGRDRAIARGRHPRRGARPPDLEHGTRRHDELGHARQQGPRGDRGAPAVRCSAGPHRRRRAPAVDRPLDGRVRRRLDDRAGIAARHAAADLAGLDWPNRVGGVGRPLDWTKASSWDFEPLDADAFPAVRLAKRVGRARGTYPAVFNAANEQAVDAFHDGRLAFLGIVETIERVVDAHDAPDRLTRESLAAAEAWARDAADRAILARQ